MSFRNKAGTDPGERFRRPYDKITVVSKTVCNFIKEFLAIRKGKVNGYIATKDDVKFTKPGKRHHEIEFLELYHRPDFIFNRPGITKHGKITLEGRSRRPQGHLKERGARS